MAEIGVGRSPALPAEPPAQDILCTIPADSNIEEQKRKARKCAKRVFKMHNLTRLILEREYMAERRAIIEKVSPGIVLHEGEGYEISDPTFRRIPELEALERKYRSYISEYRAVEDVMSVLDEDTRRLVELCYMEGKPIAWVVTHSHETGLFYCRAAIQKRLRKANELLAYRLGWLSGP